LRLRTKLQPRPQPHGSFRSRSGRGTTLSRWVGPCSAFLQGKSDRVRKFVAPRVPVRLSACLAYFRTLLLSDSSSPDSGVFDLGYDLSFLPLKFTPDQSGRFSFRLLD